MAAGPFLAADHDDVVPDLVTLERISVGLQPAGGVLVGGQIRDTIERGRACLFTATPMPSTRSAPPLVLPH